MSKPEIILIGAGGHAHACIDVIEQQDYYQIAGLVGNQDEINTQHLGYSVIATDNDLAKLVKVYQYAFIAVGQILSPDKRIYLYQQAINIGFRLPTIISPTAYVSRHASVGAGSVVMHGAIINAGAKVGENCIINTRVLIEHDVIVDDCCHVSTGAVVNGSVKISKGSFVGSSAVIKEGVTVGKSCVVGMGLSLRHDLADYSRCVGNYQT